MTLFVRAARWIIVPCALAALVFMAPAAWAGAEPLPAQVSLEATGCLAPGTSDRCPVCAMLPARRPQWAAALTLKEGTTFYFCSNGCLLRAWLRPRTYLARSRTAIDRLVVGDYFSGQPVDARRAVWIAGSDVIGPMGPALVALGDADHLAAFQRRHGGQTVFAFDDLDDALWRRIHHHALPPVEAP